MKNKSSKSLEYLSRIKKKKEKKKLFYGVIHYEGKKRRKEKTEVKKKKNTRDRPSGGSIGDITFFYRFFSRNTGNCCNGAAIDPSSENLQNESHSIYDSRDLSTSLCNFR